MVFECCAALSFEAIFRTFVKGSPARSRTSNQGTEHIIWIKPSIVGLVTFSVSFPQSGRSSLWAVKFSDWYFWCASVSTNGANIYKQVTNVDCGVLK